MVSYGLEIPITERHGLNGNALYEVKTVKILCKLSIKLSYVDIHMYTIYKWEGLSLVRTGNASDITVVVIIPIVPV